MVNTTSDVSLTTGCNGEEGLCSLRGAIEMANASPEVADTITFDPAVFPPDAPATITIGNTLLLEGGLAITIDGANAGVVVDGDGEPSSFDCFTLAGPHTIANLQLTDCLAGVSVQSDGATIGPGNTIFDNWRGIFVSARNTVIKGNRIGTDPMGAVVNPAGGNSAGIQVYQATGVTIGGASAADRNIISGNGDGIEIEGDDGPGAGTNVVIGNYIGLDVTGTADLGNAYQGITVGNDGDDIQVIGGTTPAERNVISGNGGTGILLLDASGTVMSGNYVGTDATGTVAIGNEEGVHIEGSESTLLGGDAPAATNVISGNNWLAVVISGAGAVGNIVQGNYIGTDASGAAGLGNGAGVSLGASAQDNIIGPTLPGSYPQERNVIADNGNFQVWLSGPSTEGNLIRGNYIGLGADGSTTFASDAPG
ncbi:MAG TPA: hypothetical protein VLS25_07945, partial [Dehalococcoidia bacterium]|nr:hypothetical protein [Dehalococcoidia bacterium]